MSYYEEGKYKANITNWGLAQAKTGTLQAFFTFQPTHLWSKFENSWVEPDEQNKERSIYRAITDKSIDYVIQDLERLGYDRDTFDELDREHPNAFDFMDKEIEVEMELEDYNGKPTERWKFSWGSTGQDRKPLERKDVSKLNSLFGAKLKALKKNSNTKPAPAEAATKSTEEQAEEVF